MFVRIVRKKASLQYLKDDSKPFDWHNNDGNNALDVYELYDDYSNLVLTSRVQTVSNMEGLDPTVHFYDTIAPGAFFLEYGIAPRSFRCLPLGIIGATTFHGDFIRADDPTTPVNEEATTVSNASRWLEHDRKGHDGADTRVCWSAGCIVHWNDDDLVQINKFLAADGIKPHELIRATLVMEVAA